MNRDLLLNTVIIKLKDMPHKPYLQRYLDSQHSLGLFVAKIKEEKNI